METGKPRAELGETFSHKPQIAGSDNTHAVMLHSAAASVLNDLILLRATPILSHWLAEYMEPTFPVEVHSCTFR